MRKNQIIPGLMLCGIAALLLPAFRQAQDPNVELCASYMNRDTLMLNQYISDYDESFPTWVSDADLHNKLRPYQHSFTYSFDCPATRKPYIFNNALQGISLPSIGDPTNFEALRDAAPHPDGFISIGYVDGHVLHNGGFTGDTSRRCVFTAYNLSQGILMYTQDYDELLPPMNSPVQVQTETLPYVKASYDYSCPNTGQMYQYNAALGGTSLLQYADRSAVWLLHDAVPHPIDGISTTAFLDGHVYHQGYPLYPPPANYTSACLDTAWSRTRSILMYAQDYDETLPDMTNANSTILSLYPYLNDGLDFLCPQTGLQYLFNASISGRALSSFPNLNDYWVLSDAIAHPDGQKTFSYLNGTVLHPGVVENRKTLENCISSVRFEVFSTILYAQDWDEHLPPMQSSDKYIKAINPYIPRRISINCPVTLQPYLPSSEFSGVLINTIQNPVDALILQDFPPHPNGRATLGYLDGHVSKKVLVHTGIGGIRRNGGGGSRNSGGRSTLQH